VRDERHAVKPTSGKAASSHRNDAIDDQGFAVALNLRDPDGIALEFYFLLRRGGRETPPA
jgi:hypothetical protein